MEIKLNAGDKIQIPTGCKATIKDDFIVIEEQEEKQAEFKEGDILISKSTNNIVIFKSYSKRKPRKFESCWNNAQIDDCDDWACDSFRHVTEEEKEILFDKLEARDLRWNAETKQMEKIRERVNKRENYLIVNRLGEIHLIPEEYSLFDDMNFNSGNYYLPSEKEQAEEDAKAIRAIFEKRLKI